MFRRGDRPDDRKMIRQAGTVSILALGLWAVLALMAWGMTMGMAGPMKAGTTGTKVQPGAARYSDPSYGFSFDHPADWTPNPLAPDDPPGAVLGLPGTVIPGSVGGVEFPNSSHIDLSLVVQDASVPAAVAWGSAPADILAHMAASQGREAAVSEATALHETTAGGVEVWGLRSAPAFATERIWAMAQVGRYNYLFFLAVGGAADDRGTVQQMFDDVIPSFRVAF